MGKWPGNEGAASLHWRVQDGYVEVTPPKGNDIRTRGKWSDFQLHVEWAAPAPPAGHGQARGNSGILINNMHEVQVLDSYNDKTYPDGQAWRDLRPDASIGQSPANRPLNGRPTTSFGNHRAGTIKASWSKKLASRFFSMESSCSIGRNSSAARMELEEECPGRDNRFTSNTPRRSLSNYRITTPIPCDTAISGSGTCI